MSKNKPTHRKHNPYHDYRERCIYHITLVVSDRCKVLGRMVDCREEKVAIKNATSTDGNFSHTNGWNEVKQANGSVLFVSPDGEAWTEAQMAETARVELTPLGFEISEAINAIPYEWGKRGVKAQILQKVVMPEHLHFLLFIQQPMEKRLQMLMRGWKQGCNKRLKKYLGIAESAGKVDEGDGVKNASLPNGNYSQNTPDGGSSQQEIQGMLPSGAEVFLRSSNTADIAPFLREASPRILTSHAIFEEDFDETRLRRKGQLRSMIDYVHNNPKHRWLRSHKPEWLLPVRGIEIAGRKYDAIGNINLLALPRFQDHTRYKWYQNNDTESIRNHMNDCVILARKNYAIVSPFVHPDEAKVRDFCLQEGHSIIQLMDNGFSDLQQCPGGLYDYCVNGQVLLLVPSDWPHIDNKGKCTRQECNILNGYAEEIVNENC